MSQIFRSSHIPLSFASHGYTRSLIPNLALASWNRDNNDVDKTITNWKLYTVTAQEEFAAPTLSWKLYGDMHYWWFLCWYNGIVNPTRELIAGMTIKVPNQTQMETYLNGSSTSVTPEYTRL